MARRAGEKELTSFIGKYSPEVRAIANKALAHLRKLLPAANELIYDNYNALVVGFAATERASDAVISIALYPRWVNLYFLYGATLQDPHKILKGSGSRVRRLRIDDDATILNTATVQSLLTAALKASRVKSDSNRRGKIIIKAVAAKQRSRRP